jgi:hypothetical protein
MSAEIMLEIMNAIICTSKGVAYLNILSFTEYVALWPEILEVL